MESYRHPANGAADSSRYQQLPTRSGTNQPDAASGAAAATQAGTRNILSLSTGVRVDSSSASSSSDNNDYTDSCSSSECSSSSWRYSELSLILRLRPPSSKTVCLLSLQYSSESVPEWESHIDSQGELFYVQFSSNLHQPNLSDSARQPNTEERQEVLKKKKKSIKEKFASPLQRLCS